MALEREFAAKKARSEAERAAYQAIVAENNKNKAALEASRRAWESEKHEEMELERNHEFESRRRAEEERISWETARRTEMAHLEAENMELERARESERVRAEEQRIVWEAEMASERRNTVGERVVWTSERGRLEAENAKLEAERLKWEEEKMQWEARSRCKRMIENQDISPKKQRMDHSLSTPTIQYPPLHVAFSPPHYASNKSPHLSTSVNGNLSLPGSFGAGVSIAGSHVSQSCGSHFGLSATGRCNTIVSARSGRSEMTGI